MTGHELRERMREEAAEAASWIDWEKTCDQFLAGDPGQEIVGAVISWLSTLDVLREAKALGANLLVTHEPFYAMEAGQDTEGVYGGWIEKKRWLADSGMILYRCHDFWDDYPEVGIHGAWARWLGFEGRPLAQQRYYEVHATGGVTLGEMASRVLERVRPLGQETVGVLGDFGRRTEKIALGTGAITRYQQMAAMDADVLLLTDDGTRLWETAQWARDSGASVLLVNHATAEEPGMMTLREYMARLLPVPVRHIPVGCLYRSVNARQQDSPCP